MGDKETAPSRGRQSGRASLARASVTDKYLTSERARRGRRTTRRRRRTSNARAGQRWPVPRSPGVPGVSRGARPGTQVGAKPMRDATQRRSCEPCRAGESDPARACDEPSSHTAAGRIASYRRRVIPRVNSRDVITSLKLHACFHLRNDLKSCSGHVYTSRTDHIRERIEIGCELRDDDTPKATPSARPAVSISSTGSHRPRRGCRRRVRVVLNLLAVVSTALAVDTYVQLRPSPPTRACSERTHAFNTLVPAIATPAPPPALLASNHRSNGREIRCGRRAAYMAL